ncbi:MAG TPA: RNA-binding S4 domain-containing protein [Flavobacteriales bacterium]|nr:RNA-binding S4 domain-containing protein [Flavobacteriales bacterium]
MPSASIDFDLRGEFIELNQLLKLAGLCNSGGEGKMLVAQGLVKVDGAVELRKTYKVRAGQLVSYRNTVIKVLADQQDVRA